MVTESPVAWAMPPLPVGWYVEHADVDKLGYYLGGRRSEAGSMEPALVIRLRHDEPSAHVRVALRTLGEFVEVLRLLEAMSPKLPDRPGVLVSLEMNYY